MTDLDILFKLSIISAPVEGDNKLIISKKGVDHEQWSAIIKLAMLLRIVGNLELHNKFKSTMSIFLQDFTKKEKELLFVSFDDARKLVEDGININYNGKLSFPDIVNFLSNNKKIRFN